MKTFSLCMVSCFGLLVGCGSAPAKVTVSFNSQAAVDALQPPVGSIEVRAYKVKTLKFKGIDGVQLEPRLLDCVNEDPTQWKYAKEVVTVTEGTIVKGTSGKVDVFANNEDVIFEITAQSNADGSGEVYGHACAILPAVKSGSSRTLAVDFCTDGSYSCPAAE